MVRGLRSARHELIPLVYQELKTLSRRVLRREGNQKLTATASVHDLYLKLAPYDSIQWNDRGHFFSFCAHLMRQILVDQARERMAAKRTANIVPLGFEEVPWIGQDPSTYMDLEKLSKNWPARGALKSPYRRTANLFGMHRHGNR